MIKIYSFMMFLKNSLRNCGHLRTDYFHSFIIYFPKLRNICLFFTLYYNASNQKSEYKPQYTDYNIKWSPFNAMTAYHRISFFLIFVVVFVFVPCGYARNFWLHLINNYFIYRIPFFLSCLSRATWCIIFYGFVKYLANIKWWLTTLMTVFALSCNFFPEWFSKVFSKYLTSYNLLHHFFSSFL